MYKYQIRSDSKNITKFLLNYVHNDFSKITHLHTSIKAIVINLFNMLR